MGTVETLAEASGTSLALDPVRVAFLIDRLGIGGTEIQLLALIRHLDRTRVKPHLILLDGQDATSAALRPADCPVLALGVTALCSPRGVRQLGHLARYLKQQRIEVVQTYFLDSTYFGVLAAELAGARAVIRVRNNTNYWMTPGHRLLGRLINPLVSLTVCNCEAGREAVLRDERPDASAVVVVENGVDLDRFDHIPPVDPTQGRPRRVGMVANLRPVKGIDILIRAAALVVQEDPGVEFVVVGEGPQRRELERLVGELGLTGRFHLPGIWDDIPAFLATLDIAVLTSRAEGMPNAVLEYMAAGRPVVASAVGAIPHLIDPERSGVVVPPGDPESLATGLKRLLSAPGNMPLFGETGRHLVRERYDRPSVSRRFSEIWERTARGYAHAG
jgi:glycosyltransferase involved in cell wall biosynthesis